MDCPRCGVALHKTSGPLGMHFGCTLCKGRLVTTPVVRKATSPRAIASLLSRARQSERHGAPCPMCRKEMAEIVDNGPIRGEIDVCSRCQFIWFDDGEWSRIPPKPKNPSEGPGATQNQSKQPAPLPSEAVVELSKMEMRQAYERDSLDIHRAASQLSESPIAQSRPIGATPITWFLAAVTLLIYAKIAQHGEPIVELLSLSPTDPWRFMGATFLTAPLAHNDWAPMLFGLAALILFGRPCEDAAGSPRVAAILVIGTVVGGFAHLMTAAGEPLVGNGHTISALVAFFSVRFPSARIPYLFPYFRGTHHVRWGLANVWILFVGWIGVQLIYALAEASDVSIAAITSSALVGAIAGFATKPNDIRPADVGALEEKSFGGT